MLKQVTISGKEVDVQRLKFGQTIRIIAIMKANVTKLGLSPEELKGKDMSNLSEIVGLVSSLLGKAFEDYDLDTDRPGPLLTDVVKILSGMSGLSEEEVLSAQFDELYDFIRAIVEQEAESSVGKSIGGMIQPIISLISEAIGMVKAKIQTQILIASAGGLSNGGETSSSTQSVESTESFQENSTPLNSENSSDSSEA